MTLARKPSIDSKRAQYSASKSHELARATRPDTSNMSATAWWYQVACSLLTPSLKVCASASRVSSERAASRQRALSSHRGQVTAATNNPVASPSRWLLAEE